MAVLRYWAAAKAAAGVAEERCLEGNLADALSMAASRHGEPLSRVLDRCSFLVDGDPVGGRDRGAIRLTEQTVVEVLPPFAGG